MPCNRQALRVWASLNKTVRYSLVQIQSTLFSTSQKELLPIVVVDFRDKSTGNQAESQCNGAEKSRKRRLDTWMGQVSFARLACVVQVAVAHLLRANPVAAASLVAAGAIVGKLALGLKASAGTSGHVLLRLRAYLSLVDRSFALGLRQAELGRSMVIGDCSLVLTLRSREVLACTSD